MTTEHDLKLLAEYEDDSGGSWIVTYADLITLMLTFFILLYSMSSLELERFKYVMHSIQGSLGTTPVMTLDETATDTLFTDHEQILAGTSEVLANQRRKDMLKEIQDFIEQAGLKENIEVTLFQSKIVIRIKDRFFFESGESAMNHAAVPILDKIVDIFVAYPEFSIDIAGHTDDRPISTPEFPSNWELSTIRATSVLRILINDGIDPKRLTATGYADVMPLVENDSPENRSKNRRVEFILEKAVEDEDEIEAKDKISSSN